jgi:hypothetical protein
LCTPGVQDTRGIFPESLISHKEKQTGMDRRNKQTQEQMKSEGNKEILGEASKRK